MRLTIFGALLLTDHVNGKQSSKKNKNKKQHKPAKKEVNKENFLSVLFVNKAVKKTTGPSNIECLDVIIFEDGTLGFGF